MTGPPEGGARGEAPIRVLFVVSQLGLGGTEKNLVELVLGLDRRRFTPEVLVFEAGGAYETTLRDAGVPIGTVRRHRGRYLDRTLAIRARCRSFAPHVVQGFGVFVGPYVAVAATFARTPFVAGTLFASGMPGPARVFYRLAWRAFDRVVCNNRKARTFLTERCRLPAGRVAVIRNGLDFARMDAGRATAPSLRRELGLGTDTLLVGAVGKLNAEKDPMTFVRAAALIGARRPDAAFCFIGSGPDRARVEAYVRDHGLDARIALVPQRPDAAWVSREFDVAVLSSATEGLPTVVTEYMYWGRPCVVTDVGDCADVVVHDRTGLVVAPGDPEALAEAVLRLLADPALRAAFGEAGRRRVLEHFSIERYVEEYQALYLDGLGA